MKIKLTIFNAFWFLQPRWYGEHGEAERYLEKQCSKLSTADGDKLYARTALYSQTTVMDDVMNDTRLSCPRVKRGVSLIIKENPDWLYGRAE